MDGPLLHPQLILAFDTVPTASFVTYFTTASNALTVGSVVAFCDGKLAEQQVYLWGEHGVGKSHLLSAACQTFTTEGYRVAYLTGELANKAEALSGLEQCDLLCVDDLQHLQKDSEVAFFHCINRCRQANTQLLLAADRQPDHLGIALPDLTTRLKWGPVFHLPALNDKELGDAIRHQLESRALQISDDVIDYLLKRFPRDIASLKQLIDQLDKTSMTEQRRITIPLVRQVMAESVFGPG